MKRILLMLSAGILFAACSSPKYTYYFDRVPTKTTASSIKPEADPKEGKANGIVQEKSSTLAPESLGEKPAASQEETLVASSSEKKVVLPATRNKAATDKGSRTSLLKITKEDRRALLKTIKEFKAIKKLIPASVKEGDPKKNPFAVIGFISVFASLLVGAISVPLLSTLFFLLALAFCIVGLQSEQRALAKAGLIILGIIFALGLVILLIVLAAFSGTV